MDRKQLHLFDKPSGRTSILTASGFIFDLANPDATGLPVEDVARSLAFQPRWCGATKAFYSVAEHSVMVSKFVTEHLAYDALFHDCLEFITGDWPSPLKIFLGRDELKKKLRPVEIALEKWFGFDSHLPVVKIADNIAMATELRDQLPAAWMDWGHLPDPDPEKVQPVGPEEAFSLFMERYEQVKHLARPAVQMEVNHKTSSPRMR